jgi:hexokinase
MSAADPAIIEVSQGDKLLHPVNEQDVVDVGVDGSLVEFYPNFEFYMREAPRASIGASGERHIRIGIAKDGSGVGAAIIALLATQQTMGTKGPGL